MTGQTACSVDLYCSLPQMTIARSLASVLARDTQAKLALIVAHCLSIHLSICVSVCDSLSHAYVPIRSIAIALRIASHVDCRLVYSFLSRNSLLAGRLPVANVRSCLVLAVPSCFSHTVFIVHRALSCRLFYSTLWLD